VAAQAVTPQATQASGPSGAPVDVILSAEERQLQQAYRADVVETTSGSATTALTLTILYSSPGNVQIITPSGMEMIILEGAGTVWQLGLDGTWSQLPRDEAQNVISSLPLLSSTQVSQLKQQIIVAQTTFAGLTTVNGVPAWAYDYATTAAASSASGPSEIWIGVANGLPLKAQSTSSASSGTGQATTVITYQYDSSIKVQAPG
jgi:outer membrane lipoprotein-sorting protein